MRDVLELVKKNFKNLLRAKTSSLIVILGPLIVIFLAGMAFDNSSVYSVKVGTYQKAPNDVSNLFIDQLREEFKIYEFPSEKECKDAIKDAQVNACMVFAGDFKVGSPPRNEIKFYVDYSRMNLVHAIMTVVNKEVSEHSLAASEDLTKALLQTIEYTKERIRDQRETVVQLTTENELINRNAHDLQAELGDIDLRFDSEGIPVDNLSSSKTQVKQWVDNALSLGNRGLSEAQQFIDAADELVRGSGASEGTQNSLLASFQSSVDDINELKADMEKTEELTQESFERFDEQFSQLVAGIDETKGRLQQADTSRQFSLRVLESMTLLLDKSLLSVLSVQSALNDIENKIDSIEITDAEGITQPIVTKVSPIVQEKTYLNYLFPVLIVLVMMFTALLMTPTLILLDKNSPASFRTYMTPVKDSSYVIANFLTSFTILFVQMVVILAIVSVFFQSSSASSVSKALVLLVLINALFTLLGMIVGYVFKTEETATLAAVTVGATLLFISDVIVPLESMPEAFAYIASFNPYVLGSSLVRMALLFDASVASMVADTLLLAGYIAAFSLIATGAYMATRKHSLKELSKQLKPVLARIHWPNRKKKSS